MSSRLFSVQGPSVIEACSLLPESHGTIFRTMEPVISDQPHNLNDVIYFVARFLHPEVHVTDDFFTDPYLWQRLIESNFNVFAQASGCLALSCGTSSSSMLIDRCKQSVTCSMWKKGVALAVEAIDRIHIAIRTGTPSC